MGIPLLERWATALHSKHYYLYHFVSLQQELAEELLDTLLAHDQSFTPALTAIVEYVNRSPLNGQDVLDSLFRLRDLLSVEVTVSTRNENYAVSNVEKCIIQLSALFERETNAVARQLIHPVSAPGMGNTTIPLELDHQFYISELNSVLLERFNYSRDEIIDTPFSALFSETSQSIIRHAREQFRRGERALMEIDVEAVPKFGEPFRTMVRIRRKEPGNSIRTYSVDLYDLASQEETRNILNLMLLALESVNDGIVIMEPQLNGNILFLNRVVEETTGYERSDLYGQPFSMLSGKHYSTTKAIEMYERSLDEGWKGHLHQVSKNGENYQVAFHTRPVYDITGDVVAIVGIMRDVVREKEHREEIQNLQYFIEQITNNLQDYILVTEGDDIIRFWNHSIERDSSITAKSAIGKNLFMLCGELAPLNKEFNHQRPPIDKPLTRRGSLSLFGGGKRIYEVSRVRLYADHEDSPLLWVIRDIHDRELQKERIKWQNERLRFLEHLAHTLNSTLDLNQAIYGFATEFGRIFGQRLLSIVVPSASKESFQLLYSSVPTDNIPVSSEGLIEISARLQPRLLQDQVVTLSIEDNKKNPYFSALKQTGIENLHGFPVTFSGKLIGYIFIDSGKKMRLHQEDLDFIEQILDHLALAMNNCMQFDQLEKQISRRIQAEQAWVTSFNEIHLGLAVIDNTFTIKRGNRRFWHLFRRELPLPTAEVNCEEVFEERIADVIINAITNEGQPTELEAVEWPDKINGKYLSRRFFPIYEDENRFAGGIFTVQDITEKRVRDQHIRYLSRFPEINPNVLVLSLNLVGKVVYCNTAGRDALKHSSTTPNELEGLIPLTLTFEIQNNQFKSGVSREYILNLGDKVFQFIAFKPEDDENIYLTGLDMTERLELQNKLIQTERMRAMGEMASGVAHDFNNLLTTIIGRTQLIQLKCPDTPFGDELSVVERAAKDGAHIVKRLQELTRTNKEPKRQPVYLSEIINDSILYSSAKTKFKNQVAQQETNIVQDMSDNLIVLGNPTELKEIFTNLIFNAYDAMPEGGSIFLSATALNDQFAEIRVRDTGTGMPPSVRKKIFDPFFTTKGERGTGLGLSLVYKIATSHKGTIKVESAVGRGTEFIITLPRSLHKPEAHPRVSGPLLDRAGNIQLLVVDDELELLETIAEVLRLKFKRVDMARSGMEALQKVAVSNYDIVLTDLGMPEMSGWELARAIKERTADTRVILVTGWGVQAEEEHENHSYVDKILPKPYDLHNLLSVIEQLENSNSKATERITPQAHELP